MAARGGGAVGGRLALAGAAAGGALGAEAGAAVGVLPAEPAGEPARRRARPVRAGQAQDAGDQAGQDATAGPGER